jgi:hypothetical protein
MMSGFMWNQIRMPPYHGGSPQNPEYISSGFQQQFVAETQIVAFLCKCLIDIVVLFMYL